MDSAVVVVAGACIEGTLGVQCVAGVEVDRFGAAGVGVAEVDAAGVVAGVDAADAEGAVNAVGGVRADALVVGAAAGDADGATRRSMIYCAIWLNFWVLSLAELHPCSCRPLYTSLGGSFGTDCDGSCRWGMCFGWICTYIAYFF